MKKKKKIPEWGTPEATKKARDMVPGQEDMDIVEDGMTSADAGIPHDTKDMGPRLKLINVTDRRRKKDKPPVLLKRFRKFVDSDA